MSTTKFFTKEALTNREKILNADYAVSVIGNSDELQIITSGILPHDDIVYIVAALNEEMYKYAKEALHLDTSSYMKIVERSIED